MDKQTKKIIGLVGLGLTCTGAGLVGGFLLDTPTEVDVDSIKVEAFNLGVNSVTIPEPVVCETCEVCETPDPIVITKNITTEKIVEVADEEFITLLCDRDSYDDIKECEEEVKAEDEALKLAVAEIEKEFADELEDADIVDDEDDVEIVRIYDDFADVDVKESDFDDEEYRFEIRVKIDDDEADKKKYVLFDVEVEDSEASIRKVKEDN